MSDMSYNTQTAMTNYISNMITSKFYADLDIDLLYSQLGDIGNHTIKVKLIGAGLGIVKPNDNMFKVYNETIGLGELPRTFNNIENDDGTISIIQYTKVKVDRVQNYYSHNDLEYVVIDTLQPNIKNKLLYSNGISNIISDSMINSYVANDIILCYEILDTRFDEYNINTFKDTFIKELDRLISIKIEGFIDVTKELICYINRNGYLYIICRF